MPIIPQIESKETYPIAQMPPGVAGQAGATIERVGRQMEGLGEFGGQVVNAIQKAMDNSLLMQLENSLDADLDRELLNYKKRTDYLNYPEASTKFVTELQKKYSEMTSSNPRVSQAFNLHLQKKSTAFSHAITVKTLDDMVKFDEVQYDNKYRKAIDDMAVAATDEERQQKADIFVAETKELVKSANISPEKGNKAIVGLKKDSQQGMLTLAMNSTNVDVLKATNTDIDKGKFNLLDAKERAGAKIHIQNRIETLQKVNKTEQEEKVINFFYAPLKSMFGNNYNAMIDTVLDPDWQKRNEVPYTTAHKLAAQLRADKATEENKTKKLHEKTSVDAFILLSKGQLSKSWIDYNVKNGFLSPEKGEHFNKELLNPPDVPPNPRTYLELRSTIWDGRFPKFEMENKILSSNIPRQDKIELGKFLYSEENKDIDKAVKEGEAFIEKQIIPTRGMEAEFRTTFKEEAEAYNAIQSFKTKIENARKTGKPLSNEDIADIARSVAKSHMVPLSQRMIEYIDAMKAAGKELKQGIIQKKESEQESKKKEKEKKSYIQPPIRMNIRETDISPIEVEKRK